MAGIFGYSREAIRVKVTKCEGVLQPEYRKFSVDPQITSFEVLQSILAKAFDIKGEFTVCYRTFDDYGQETYLSLLSDWDLDAAFLSASEPCLCLQVDMKPFEESSEDWDVLGCIDVPRTQVPETKPQNRLPGLIMNQVERTFNLVQRALNLVEDQQTSVSNQPPRAPLTDAEFRRFLDPIGQVVQARELRTVIYLGGIEPSLRKVLWKHILNVYPEGMSGKERMDYMKKKAYEYQALRDCWRDIVQKGQVIGDLAYVTSMVRKDVLRTDRHHKFYAGSDDNQNIASLFNILTTYALNHPRVSYCQGMSDLASPLLVTMGDEAHAYICFVALMKRLQSNFLLDGVTMTLKFQHLAEGLMYYDPEFYAYLKFHQADDLLFCYRWLLLEMKREFAFDDALRMLEVLWSSLPQTQPSRDLPLYEQKFSPPGDTSPPISPLVKTRENPYTKVCALRRQSSSVSLHCLASVTTRKGRHGPCHRQNQSLDETVIGRAKNLGFRDQNRVKTFASLDDTSIQLLSNTQESKSCSLTPCETNGDMTTTRNNQINSQSSPKQELPTKEADKIIPNDLVEQNEKDDEVEKFSTISDIVEIIPSSDKTNVKNISKEDKELNRENSQQVRVVKNLNEFLSFSVLNKNRLLHENCVSNVSPRKESNQSCQSKTVNGEFSDRTSSSDQDTTPVITLTESSFDESEMQSESWPSGEKERIHNVIRQNRCEDDAFCDGSSPDDSTEYFPMTTSMTRELRLELENLDRQVFGSRFTHRSLTLEDSEELESPCSESFRSVEVKIEPGSVEQKCDCVVSKHESELQSEDTTTEVAEICSEPNVKPTGLKLKLEHQWQHCSSRLMSDVDEVQNNQEFEAQSNEDDKCNMSGALNLKLKHSVQHLSPAHTIGGGSGEEIFVWENPLQCPTTPDEQADLEYDGSVVGIETEMCFSTAMNGGEIFENEGQGVKSVTPIRLLRSGVGSIQGHHRPVVSRSPTEDGSDSSDGWCARAGSTTSCHSPLTKSEGTPRHISRVLHLDKVNQAPSSPSRRRDSRDIFAPTTAAMTNSFEEMTEHSAAPQPNPTAVPSVIPTSLSSDVTRHPAPFAEQPSISAPTHLPPPQEFGGGNPFLMFLCLTVLRQHRDFIIRNAMDYNEMAMHFDKMVRKHNVTRVLNQARQMYAGYLRQQATVNNNSTSIGADPNV